MRNKFITLLLVIAAAYMSCAQAAWPDRPIQMIVAYPPGGFTDALARAVAKPLGERLNQQVIVQNVSGGGGNIGAARAAKATLVHRAFIYLWKTRCCAFLPVTASRRSWTG